MVNVKVNKNIKECGLQKKTEIVNAKVMRQAKEYSESRKLEEGFRMSVMDYGNGLAEKEHKISQRYTNLKEDVLKMIAIINPKEYGLLKSLQNAIINAQDEYHYGYAMQSEEIRRQILND